jgi:hypothetical protein
MEIEYKVTSEEFFKKKRFEGIVDMILNWIGFEEKLKYMSINRKFGQMVKTKIKYLKVTYIYDIYSFYNI